MATTHPVPPDEEGLEELYVRAIASYVARRHPGVVTIFRSGEWPTRRPGRDWAAVSARLEIHLVPGDHYTAITRHVGELGAHLNAHLQRAQPT